MLITSVALRKESVDRNWYSSRIIMSVLVALRKESVDRNQSQLSLDPINIQSLSARRAWIEMEDDGILSTGAPSLSARRAWIEIRSVPR